MTIVLALDLSTKPGWAVMSGSGDAPKLIAYGTNFDIRETEPNPDFIPDFHLLSKADLVAAFIRTLLMVYSPDEIWVEQTNAGSYRTAQKQLEFIHCVFLQAMRSLNIEKKINYVDTSAWRRGMEIKLSKEQKLHNKAVKKKLVRGKITPKHLAVNWVNEKFGLSLLVKDDDAAEGILMGCYALKFPRNKPTKITDEILTNALS
jgi:hypothetical protein